mmetsp:Transcript_28975/g.42576  ORF Transcript_28975/g.42576 Transcript_28975/m.42576 type:complete len:218 (+) Transcript_28975:566-1219(+)
MRTTLTFKLCKKSITTANYLQRRKMMVDIGPLVTTAATSFAVITMMTRSCQELNAASYRDRATGTFNTSTLPLPTTPSSAMPWEGQAKLVRKSKLSLPEHPVSTKKICVSRWLFLQLISTVPRTAIPMQVFPIEANRAAEAVAICLSFESIGETTDRTSFGTLHICSLRSTLPEVPLDVPTSGCAEARFLVMESIKSRSLRTSSFKVCCSLTSLDTT